MLTKVLVGLLQLLHSCILCLLYGLQTLTRVYLSVLQKFCDTLNLECEAPAGTWLCFVNLVVVRLLNWLGLLK